MLASPPRLGRREPRLGTDPRGPLTRESTLGFEVIDFARDVLEEPLLPWQEEAALRALELNGDGTFRFRTVLILVARQAGKTHLLRTIALWRLFVDQAALILSVAQSLDIAREAWRAGCEAVDAIEDLRAERARVSRVNGDEYLQLTSGARWKISAATKSAGRGLSVDMLVMDELREQRSWDAWSALSKTTQARRRGQTWCISNAGEDRSVVLNHLRAAALAGEDPSLCLLEWSAPDGCALDDPEAWAYANPSMGHVHGTSEAAIRSSLGTDPEPVFRTEVLCQHVPTLDNPPFSVEQFSALADPDAKAGTDVTFGIELGRDRKSGSIAVSSKMPDGRPLLELVRTVSSAEELVREAGAIRSRHPGSRWFGSESTDTIERELKQAGIRVRKLKPLDVCSQFQDAVINRALVHLDDPIVLAALNDSARLERETGWVWTRKRSGRDISPLYAIAEAYVGSMNTPSAVY